MKPVSVENFTEFLLIRMRAATAITDIATGMIELHVATLETYGGKSAASLDDILQAIKDALKDFDIEHAKEAAKKAVELLVPGAGKVVALVNVLNAIRDKLRREPLNIKKSSHRTPESALDDLADALVNQAVLRRECVEGIHAGLNE